MLAFLKRLRYTNSEKKLAEYIYDNFGFYPKDIELYKLAFKHKSLFEKNSQGILISNERLEYLGDAVLDTVVAYFLFKKYPLQQEGFLTDMRSRIVSRASLNKISQKIGMNRFISYVKPNDPHARFKSLGGNSLEAFVGAMFIDFGYDFSSKIIIDKIINAHLDLEEVEKNNINYKSRILEWAQKGKHRIDFKMTGTKGSGFEKLYQIQVIIDDEPYGDSADYSIKGAEQLAAEKTIQMINI